MLLKKILKLFSLSYKPYHGLVCDVIALHRYKALYFAIPKVANSSLKAYFANILSNNNSIKSMLTFYAIKDFRTANGKKKLKKNNILISSCAVKHYANYLKFCFVRNPWDRLVSCFSEKIKDSCYNDQYYINGVSTSFLKRYNKLFFAGMPFDKFANTICEIPDLESEKHFRSQYLFICDKEENIIVDFIGRFERLKSDLDYISKKCNFPKNAELPHLLKSNRANYTDYYSADLIEKVGIRYSTDIELFNYFY